MAQWEPVVGLEIHAQLATGTKMFCGCPVRAGAPPNTLVCPVCLGLPGALPVLNARAVDHAILAALALGCAVHETSIFARKNYFYPDLPKGYQISQYDQPLATDGLLEWTSGGAVTRVRILRVHLEEDAGKLLHEGFPDSDRCSYVDFNRSGVPLVEIVTRPDVRNPADAASFFERLRGILVEIGVNGGNLEEGHLRCDANVSLRIAGTSGLGTPVEVKNLNSFRYLERALEHEIARQAAVLEAGGRVAHETRLWDVAAHRTVAMRSKEEAHDYRYFSEPDLPPLVLSAARIEAARSRLPELPEARRMRLMREYGLSEYDAGQLGGDAAVARYFEAVASASRRPKAAANWITGELARKLKEERVGIDRAGIPPAELAGLIAVVDAGTIGRASAKAVFETMWGTGRTAAGIVAAEGLARIDDRPALEAIVRDVVAANPKAVAQYKGGKARAFDSLVGPVMQATRGQANPAIVRELILRELERA
jgi:aspartyl-tRNA(Asn)/glutamyl-tRNA(Gln) amidotransferase subunit B